MIPVLQSGRLKLRPIVPNDAASMVEISVYDGRFAQSEAEAIAILKHIQADIDAGQSLHWGICLKDSDEVIGSCGFYRGFVGNVAEIGYVLQAAHQGQGIMTEAVQLITEFGLSHMKLLEVVAYTTSDNPASMAVLKKAGFRQVSSENEYLKFSKT